MIHRWHLVCLLAASCGQLAGAEPKQAIDSPKSAIKSVHSAPAVVFTALQAEKKGPVLADLVQPFDPPTLDELNKQVKWQDRPVLDAMKLLRDKWAKEPP